MVDEVLDTVIDKINLSSDLQECICSIGNLKKRELMVEYIRYLKEIQDEWKKLREENARLKKALRLIRDTAHSQTVIDD